jgi:hypothetical protein
MNVSIIETIHKLIQIHLFGFTIFAIIDCGFEWKNEAKVQNFHFWKAVFWPISVPFYIGIFIARINRFLEKNNEPPAT